MSDGLDQQGFVSSGLTYDAVLRNLELIGEAATHVPESIWLAYSAIPWRMIIATRNRLIHGYLGLIMTHFGALSAVMYLSCYHSLNY